jgi:hypothetical protein
MITASRPLLRGPIRYRPDVTVNGSDRWFCLNRTFITKALRLGFAEFQVEDELSPVLFSAPGRTFVAMVLREDGPAPAPETSKSETSTEPVQPVNRPPEEPETKTDQNNMAQSNNITTLPTPERGNLKATNGHNGEATSAIKAVVDKVERIKANLRQAISDLNDTIDLLRAAEKEKKATLKEVGLRPGFRITRFGRGRSARDHRRVRHR